MNFDLSKEWVIIYPQGAVPSRKCIEDLSRCIGLLAEAGGHASPKPPVIIDADTSTDSEILIVLNCEKEGPERNGFQWRAGNERIEIFGESYRGLCNGIYSFLSALGISWPAPGQELLPAGPAEDPLSFPLSDRSAYEPSRYKGNDKAGAPWRRFVPAGAEEVKKILEENEAFVAWAARQRYDVLVFPPAVFASQSGEKLKQLEKEAAEYDISLSHRFQVRADN